jgi:hypothetical protein
MTNKQLSPAAQAVLDATDYPEDWATRIRVSTALRAIVEHCVPDDSEGHWVYIPHVLAIANELEGK